MRLVPTDKFDLQACKNLDSASNESVLDVLPALFEWTQDANWPVFKALLPHLIRFQKELIPSIKTTLSGDDLEWIWTLLVFVVPKFEKETIEMIKAHLTKLAESEDPDEIRTDLADEAKNILLNNDL